MPNNSDVVTGQLVVQGILDLACYSTFKEVLQALPDYLLPQFARNQFTNVFIGPNQPSAAERGFQWIQLNNAGDFVGTRVFSGGEWKLLWPVTGETKRIHGNSTQIPEGYSLVDATLPGWTAQEVAALQSTWVRDPTNSFWTLFDVVFTP